MLTATILVDPGRYIRAFGSRAMFDCPVLKLVSHIFEVFPQTAFHILRRPMDLNFVPEAISLSLIQVLAKRWTRDQLSFECESIPEGLTPPILNLGQSDFVQTWLGQLISKTEVDQISFLESGEKLVSVSEKRHQSSRPIAAVIVDENQKILSLGWNLRSQNRVWHAELVAVHQLLKIHPSLPRGQKLQVLTSLQPCRMCASYLLRLTQDLEGSIEVYYREPDDGPKATHTGLEGRQKLLGVGSALS